MSTSYDMFIRFPSHHEWTHNSIMHYYTPHVYLRKTWTYCNIHLIAETWFYSCVVNIVIYMESCFITETNSIKLTFVITYSIQHWHDKFNSIRATCLLNFKFNGFYMQYLWSTFLIVILGISNSKINRVIHQAWQSWNLSLKWNRFNAHTIYKWNHGDHFQWPCSWKWFTLDKLLNSIKLSINSVDNFSL